jgi:hypothetical protein
VKKIIVIVVILLVAMSCKTQNKKTTPSKDVVVTKKEEIEVEGRFLKIIKINEREYRLFLKLSDSTTVDFLTLMPLSENEIALLKPGQNNIRLIYSERFNKVRSRTEKVVKVMEPIYIFEK